MGLLSRALERHPLNSAPPGQARDGSGPGPSCRGKAAVLVVCCTVLAVVGLGATALGPEESVAFLWVRSPAQGLYDAAAAARPTPSAGPRSRMVRRQTRQVSAEVSADGGPSALQAAWGTAAEGAGRVTTATRRGAAAGRDAQLQDLTTGVTLQRFASFVAVLSGVALLMRRAVRSMRPRGAAVMSPLPPLAMMSASGEPDPRDNSAPEAEAPRDPYPAPSSPAEYVFGRPGEFARDLELLGTSPRRVLLSVGASAALGLGGNFLGVTSSLLSTLPQDVVAGSGIDAYYPVRGFKRYRSDELGYEFVYPQEWVADQTVALAKQQRGVQSLDPAAPRRAPKRSSTIPDAAFGPMGNLNRSGGQRSSENVSVIGSEVMAGFSLAGTLGPPAQAAQALLDTALAPPGRGVHATLLTARERAAGAGVAYQFEYQVTFDDPRMAPRRSISVVTERNGTLLITLTVVAPEADWATPSKAQRYTAIADSFALTR